MVVKTYNSAEPSWSNIDGMTDDDILFKIMKSMYWYRINSTKKQLKQWTLKHIKDEFGPKKVKDYKNGNKLSYELAGSICRIIYLGCPTRFVEDKLHKSLEEINKDTIYSRKRSVEAAKKSVAANKKINSKTRFNEQLKEYCYAINKEIDRFIDYPNTKKKDWFNADNSFKSKNIKPEFAAEIMKEVGSTLNEVKAALNEEDEQLVEAYDYLKRRWHTRLVEFLTNITDVARKYSDKKTPSKTGKKKSRKSISPKKLVNKLPYIKSFKEKDLDIESCEPSKIIGSSVLIVYNTVSRLVYVYVANNNVGLSVSGASIKGYNSNKSFLKKLRSPKHSINVICNITKKFAIEHIKDVKTVEKPVRPRLNKNCVIIKIF